MTKPSAAVELTPASTLLFLAYVALCGTTSPKVT
jgi:hypothetical protein